MTDVVLDAAVFISAVSPHEVHHAAADALYRSHPEDCPFLVPELFRIEVLSALARRQEPGALLDTVDVLVSGPRFHSFSMDSSLLEHALRVTRSARLRAYDALYVALALARNATLFTLDPDVKSRAKLAFPALNVG